MADKVHKHKEQNIKNANGNTVYTERSVAKINIFALIKSN